MKQMRSHEIVGSVTRKSAVEEKFRYIRKIAQNALRTEHSSKMSVYIFFLAKTYC